MLLGSRCNPNLSFGMSGIHMYAIVVMSESNVLQTQHALLAALTVRAPGHFYSRCKGTVESVSRSGQLPLWPP